MTYTYNWHNLTKEERLKLMREWMITEYGKEFADKHLSKQNK